MLLAISLAALLAGSFGCGGAQSNENSSTVVAVNNNPTANSNVVPLTPVNGMPPAANANGFPNTNQPNVTVVNPPANAKPLTFPAPDNSEYATTMDKTGEAIETRTFHDNKYITKVTRTWKGVDDKTIQIYLKNGKVVNLPGDKLPEIRSLPVESFYNAAGITVTPATSSGPPAVNKQQQTKPSN